MLMMQDHISSFVQSWDDVSNAVARGIIQITKEGTPTTYANFKVTGAVTDASGYTKVPVTHIVSSGTFSNLDGIEVNFNYSGADGSGDVSTDGTQTLTNKTLTSPKIGTKISDTNGNELLNLTATSSAVNELTLTNAATGNNPLLSASGGDSNVSLKVGPKGTGNVEIMGATNPGSIQLNCENNTHGIKLTSPPHSSAQSYELKFPTGNVTADRFLKVDSVSGSGTTGIGQLSFSEVSGGTSWQSSVKTANFTAAAGEGYFVNTSGGAFEIDLPGSPSVGDEIEFVDFTRNFATANLTLDQGSNKFQGNTSPKPVYSTDGQNVKIVYSGSTQGWIPLVDDDVTFETPQSYTVDFLCIAGGGGGSGDGGAGGSGAGGYRNSFGSETSGGGGSSETALSLTPGTQYTITIGAGGAASSSNSGLGGQGGDSTIAGSDITNIVSAGGGVGGSGGGGDDDGTVGGSGGGADSGTGSAGTSNQGFKGGDSDNAGNAGGGGGGAGAVGANNSSNNPGAGGTGVASSITGSSVTRGGGGGGATYNGIQASGGSGGGGDGGTQTPVRQGSSGTANTGGGAGGKYATTPHNTGGSGVIILSMADADYTGTTSGSPTVATGVSGKTVLTFTGDGSYTA